MFDYMLGSEGSGNYAPAHETMLQYARERLLKRSPQEMAQAADVEFDEAASVFRFDSLGQKIIVGYPKCRAAFAETGETPYWAWHLIMLHYLDIADGVPLGSELISFRELQAGLARGIGFDSDSARTIGEVFGHKPAENIRKACEALGAVFTKANADIYATFPFLPRYPVTMQIWLADDEMEGTGRILLNKRAIHYLTVEDAVVAGSTVLEFMIHQYEAMFS